MAIAESCQPAERAQAERHLAYAQSRHGEIWGGIAAPSPNAGRLLSGLIFQRCFDLLFHCIQVE
jgi:hypothetical protein